MKELFERLTKAQSEFPEITLDSKNPHHGYKYVSLPHILKLIRPVLNKHGIFLTQAISEGTETGTVSLTTTLQHLDQSYSATMTARVDDGRIKGVQAIGSTITYLRRYQLCAILGLAGEEDDDGAESVRVSQAKTERPKPQKPDPKKPINDAQRKTIFAIITPIFGASNDPESRQARIDFLSFTFGRQLQSSNDLSEAEAAQFITDYQKDEASLHGLFENWKAAREEKE